MKSYEVVAAWDEEARVWVATSDDIPGLVTEAESQDSLIARLQAIVPELLEMNSHLLANPGSDNEFLIHWTQDQRVRMFA